MKPVWAVGLMTGTILDGEIDVALLKSDGKSITAFGSYTLAPYTSELNGLLAQCLEEAREWNFSGPEPDIFKQAEQALTIAQANAVSQFVEQAGLELCDIGVVGFHGQTVLHRAPEHGRPGQTRQLADGQLMADMLKTPVAYDFRSRDMAAGGQGAPLCTTYHSVLLDHMGAGTDVAILNLGGVANISWRDKNGTLVGFDTGPASAPLNDFVRSHGLGNMDRDGQLARAGQVDEQALARLLEHPYLLAPYPKSLDRFDFSRHMADGMTAPDGAALLSAFTAAAVGKGLDLLPQRPKKLIVCGGGRHNPVIMSQLQKRANVVAEKAESVGWYGDAVEAQCFAFLALRVLQGLPLTYPQTTGVPEPLCGGKLAR
ncbi:MAG TPA: anhydro-N-acetylmuramic acid kinase [Hellea balneolensis]|uniref:Anhydro-N-acetylmuramic acid kinase n=1 Tax=Hellea balneolensis TaxID=287478 RepID=A0A7V5NWS9_9PROT|nr:anhydro-N-acetylmuramic acid kinase [Hellea balneolensis]